MTDFSQRKKDQKEETMKKGARAMKECEVRKARDLDRPLPPLFPPSLNNITMYTLDCVF